MTDPDPQQLVPLAGRVWDRYVGYWQSVLNADGRYEWPGDEWGRPQQWDKIFETLFAPAGVADWRTAVEIGPGSGKYTIRVLESSAATVRAYDVSAEFLGVCERRCHEWIDASRLSLHLLEGRFAAEMLDDVTGAGWRRQVDAIFSIDSMVHVDLQHLIVYLMTAAVVLRERGKLVLTLADATSEQGFAKLIGDAWWTYREQATTGGAKFEWLGPELAGAVLTRLGFEVEMVRLGDGRDLGIIATLVDVARAQRFEEHLRDRVVAPTSAEATSPHS